MFITCKQEIQIIFPGSSVELNKVIKWWWCQRKLLSTHYHIIRFTQTGSKLQAASSDSCHTSESHARHLPSKFRYKAEHHNCLIEETTDDDDCWCLTWWLDTCSTLHFLSGSVSADILLQWFFLWERRDAWSPISVSTPVSCLWYISVSPSSTLSSISQLIMFPVMDDTLTDRTLEDTITSRINTPEDEYIFISPVLELEQQRCQQYLWW